MIGHKSIYQSTGSKKAAPKLGPKLDVSGNPNNVAAGRCPKIERVKSWMTEALVGGTEVQLAKLGEHRCGPPRDFRAWAPDAPRQPRGSNSAEKCGPCRCVCVRSGKNRHSQGTYLPKSIQI